MLRPKAGLISLFAELYDINDSKAKAAFLPFIDDVVAGLTDSGLDVSRIPVCVYESDIERAVRRFEAESVDAIIVLFLAYHPSLASAKILAATDLPVIFLDTTLCYAFDETTSPAMTGKCHGIHGVQDLCCVLRRLGKAYFIEAGHYQEGDVLNRTAATVKACQAAGKMKNCRVGLIGDPFKDMGDFAISFIELQQQIGLQVVPLQKEQIIAYLSALDPAERSRIIGHYREAYQVNPDVDESLLRKAADNHQVLAKWFSDEQLDAFSFNFLSFLDDIGLPAIPFVSATNLMAEGYGYAGEGDVLTAALCASLMKMFPDTTFTEMFCPDWAGDKVYMSHMGEANRRTLKTPALIRKNVTYVKTLNGGINPCASGLLKGGQAVLVNLSPGSDQQYTLILVPCQIVEPAQEDSFALSIHGWLKPAMKLDDFLEAYSMAGGTHHSCLCYGADIKSLQNLAKLMNWHSLVIADKG